MYLIHKEGHNIVEDTLKAILELYPIFSRMKMLRQWGGIVDICPDASPIISKTSIKGLYFNCGWGTGGFKATQDLVIYLLIQLLMTNPMN